MVKHKKYQISKRSLVSFSVFMYISFIVYVPYNNKSQALEVKF